MNKPSGADSYIRYKYDSRSILPFSKDMVGCTLDQVLCTAANMYAFDDCSGIVILEVVHEGKRYEYQGWEPGMTFTFCNEAGEKVWSRSFPQWDH